MTPTDLAHAAASTDEAARAAASDWLSERYCEAGQLIDNTWPDWLPPLWHPRRYNRKRLHPNQVRGPIYWFYCVAPEPIPVGTVHVGDFPTLAADLELSTQNPAIREADALEVSLVERPAYPGTFIRVRW